MPRRRLLGDLALLGAVLWMGLVLWRFRLVDPPATLARLTLGVLWLASLTSAAWGVGWLLWRGAGQRGEAVREVWSVILLLGAGGLSLAAWALAAAGWLRPAPLLVLLAAAALLGAWRWRRGPRPELPRRLSPVAVLLLLVVALPTFLMALVDSPFYDQLHYHLAFPAQWLRAGTVVMTRFSVYSHLPAQMGLLYAYALSSFGPSAAQLLHWGAGLMTVLTAAAIARRVRPGAGPLTAALLATTPTVVIMSTWAAADLGVAAWGAGAVLLALWLLDGNEAPGAWFLIGLLCGLAAAAKYLALLTVAAPLALALLVLGGRRPVRELAARWSLLGLGLALPLAPWLASNWLSTGDPLFPYLGGLFPTRHPELAAGLARQVGALGSTGLGGVWSLGTFAPRGEAGLIGAVHLLLLPFAALFVVRSRSRAAHLLAAVAVLAAIGWALSPQLGRYAVPVLVPIDVLAAAGLLMVLEGRERALRRGIAVLVTIAVAWSLQGAATDTGMVRLSAALGAASGDQLMRRYVSYWEILPALNKDVGPHGLVLLVGESRTLYMDCPVLAQDPFQTPLLTRLAERTPSVAGITEALRRLGVTHVLVNRAEEARMAHHVGRQHYLEPEQPAARAALARFFARALRPVAEAGPCELYLLAGPNHA